MNRLSPYQLIALALIFCAFDILLIYRALETERKRVDGIEGKLRLLGE